MLWRGPADERRHATLTMLKAMARRGWLELDNAVRPTHGTMTDNGRRALERWQAAQGGAR